MPPPDGLRLDSGDSLPELTVAYETYGSLSPDRDNAVYVCHALTGDAHVAGRHSADDRKPGWWDEMVGPGKGIDTDYYFVVCANILGGCSGTTGPSSVNPSTGKRYGSAFPDITVADIVRVEKLLLEHLGITRLAAVIGGSLGGMQALEWSIRYPEMVDRCICIAAGSSLSTQALAFDAVARDAIVSDPNWHGGDYYDKEAGPAWGLSHARKIGHITYLSPEMMQEKFGRETGQYGDCGNSCFEVERYLAYQGQKLVDRFDANSYLRITRAMGSFDLAQQYGGLEKAFAGVSAKFLIVGLSSDWLFPPEQSVEIFNALLACGKDASCCTLKAPHGHDAFLVDIKYLLELVRAFLPWVDIEGGRSVERRLTGQGFEEEIRYRLVVESISPRSRVLDLGCGNGELLTLLRNQRESSGLGVDIDLGGLVTAIDRGHDVFHGDLDDGLSNIADGSYDYAILSSTLQVVRRPRAVLNEMLRVAREGIVTFPNFANWRNRVHLGFSGRMPKSGVIPHEWYNTPNIHHTTLRDFVALCRQEGINILDMICIPGSHWLDHLLVSLRKCNLGSEFVLVRISRQGSETDAAAGCRCIKEAF